MTPQQWLPVISASVVPVVIISACGLLCLAFYNRLAAIVARLRNFHRERLREQFEFAHRRSTGGEAPDDASRHEHVMRMLRQQTIHVTRRARLVRRTLLCLLASIAALIACSFALGASIFWPPAAHVAMATFAIGLLLILIAVLHAMWELSGALKPIELEGGTVDLLLSSPTLKAPADSSVLDKERFA